jgi:antitoxin VapB
MLPLHKRAPVPRMRLTIQQRNEPMAISLDDPETDRLAREVAQLTGETVDEVVRKALAERLQRERVRRGKPSDLVERLNEIARHCASLPDYDTRSPDEILGYDEHGLWR